jgi:hypothetical protein
MRRKHHSALGFTVRECALKRLGMRHQLGDLGVPGASDEALGPASEERGRLFALRAEGVETVEKRISPGDSLGFGASQEGRVVTSPVSSA